MKQSAFIQIMRPHQYIKNIFLFLPPFFALKITDTQLLLNVCIAFISFSLTASAIYILNDYYDIEEDKKHPDKKHRPLASEAISKVSAITTMLGLFIIGSLLMSILSYTALSLLWVYVVLNIAYSFHLKQIAIVDISIIAIGFVLRLFIGAEVTNITLSKWIIIMTFLLALFLALAKRRDDVLIYLTTGEKMRKVIDGYNLQFLDTAMAIMASVVIVTYTTYTTSTEILEQVHTSYLYLTSIFVILGILRYLQVIFVFHNSGSPTKIILNDHFIQSILLGWILTFTWFLY